MFSLRNGVFSRGHLRQPLQGEEDSFTLVNTSIIIEDISKTFFRGRNENVHALDKVSFKVKDMEFFSLLGPSGCGKSTLLYIIDGLIQPTSGKVVVKGRLNPPPARDRGIVFQEYALFPWRTVLENVEYGLEIQGIEKRKRKEVALGYIKMVGLEKFSSLLPKELSGGMKQRVAIARTLCYEPDIILMDEPFGSLDAMTREQLQEELLMIFQRTKKAILFVTHSIDEAAFLSDRVAIMSPRPGKVKEIINIPLERPRDRTSEIFQKYRRIIEDILKEV